MGAARQLTKDHALIVEAANAEVHLTQHQTIVLQWIANGKRNEDIGELMNCRDKDVQATMQRIMEKTGTNTRAGAVAWALRKGLIK